MYILEGNIGAGKSTFLKLIKKHMPDVSIGLEPLHNWQSHISGQSLLSNFMENPYRWAYSMETFAMICRVREHLKDQQHHNSHLIIERSIYSGHYCFALNGYRAGFMSELEWKMYNEFFSFLIPTRCLVPRGFIYLCGWTLNVHMKELKNVVVMQKKIFHLRILNKYTNAMRFFDK